MTQHRLTQLLLSLLLARGDCTAVGGVCQTAHAAAQGPAGTGSASWEQGNAAGFWSVGQISAAQLSHMLELQAQVSLRMVLGAAAPTAEQVQGWKSSIPDTHWESAAHTPSLDELLGRKQPSGAVTL